MRIIYKYNLNTACTIINDCVEKFLKKKGIFKGLKISQQKLSQDEYEHFVQSLYEQI